MDSIDTGRLNAFNNAFQMRQQGVDRALNAVGEGLGLAAKDVGAGLDSRNQSKGDIAASKGQLESFISQHQSSDDPQIQQLVEQARAALGSL